MDKVLQYYNTEQSLYPQLAGQDNSRHPSPCCFSSVFSWQSETGWASTRSFSYFGEQTFCPSCTECSGALGPSQMRSLVSGTQASPPGEPGGMAGIFLKATQEPLHRLFTTDVKRALPNPTSFPYHPFSVSL